ncbi:SurA N-terminal domain-containing protein [Variovorax sp. J22R133]|uniref:SurA N-terminal domain-containing protein n=1 Tax=Variovorax brevis TaxID=3053503 RepID=UPI002575EE8A|nr:SurA N-terminal domain-containing protein [Variovorax sp. J22R133]MDM0113198.1 SurA N-terminal domain-containing protein [Variovorax sp. J22R133]
MFDFFRKHNKFMMVLLFLLIIPSFVFFGVERYTRDQTGEKVAHVDGTDITRPEWDARHRNEVDRIRQQMPNLDAAMLDSDAARYSTLERMVRERVLAAAAAKGRMTVSEDRLARTFAQDTGLASFRGADGKFDRALFTRATGMSPEQYEASVRAQMATQQVLLGVTASAFATKAQSDATLGALYERREIQVAQFKPADYASKVTPTDADLEAYYKEHTAQFQAPEEANIQYLVLDMDAVKKGIAVNEADLKTYYDQNSARFGTQEERRASHILINAPASATAEQRQTAKTKAEELLAQVKAAPNSFGDVARKNSQDPGSAEKGGDLDFVTRGAMVKPFEDAMFALKKGEISNLVETEFGYHIIKLDDIKPAVIQPFEKVRPAIENDLRTQQATTEFAKAAESFSDVVYQQPDSLQPAADKLKLTIQTANNVARVAAPGATGPLANRNFLMALFAADSLERKHNTEAVEVGPNLLAAGRVTQYSPARTLPFADVKEKVRALLVNQRAAEMARKDGEEKLAAWRADGKDAKLAAPVTVSRTDAQSLPGPVIEAALRADTSKLPAWVGVNLEGQGYDVVRVNKSVPRDAPNAEMAQRETAQFTQAIASAEDNAYYNMLKDRYKAEIVVPKPAETLPGAEK